MVEKYPSSGRHVGLPYTNAGGPLGVRQVSGVLARWPADCVRTRRQKPSSCGMPWQVAFRRRCMVTQTGSSRWCSRQMANRARRDPETRPLSWGTLPNGWKPRDCSEALWADSSNYVFCRRSRPQSQFTFCDSQQVANTLRQILDLLRLKASLEIDRALTSSHYMFFASRISVFTMELRLCFGCQWTYDAVMWEATEWLSDSKLDEF